MPRLTIRLFGYPQLQVDDKPVRVERRKTLAASKPVEFGTIQPCHPYP